MLRADKVCRCWLPCKHTNNNTYIYRPTYIQVCISNFVLFSGESSDTALTGDFEKICCLPLINGKHRDLRSISHHTVSNLLRHIKCYWLLDKFDIRIVSRYWFKNHQYIAKFFYALELLKFYHWFA